MRTTKKQIIALALTAVLGFTSLTSLTHATAGDDFKTANTASTGTLLSTTLWMNLVNGIGDNIDAIAGALTSESDPQVGTLTDTKWCTASGSEVDCTADAPAGGDASYGSSASSPVDAIYVDDSGNVGISDLPIASNTVSPSTVSIGNNTGAALILADYGSSGTDTMHEIMSNDKLFTISSATDNGDGTYGSIVSRLSINSSGNVGIGTTSPDGKLEVDAGSSHIRLTNSGANESWIWNLAGSLRLRGNTNLVLQDQGGDVGIGTTNPERDLHISGGANSAALALEGDTGGILFIGQDVTNSTEDAFMIQAVNNDYLRIGRYSGGSYAEYARFNNSGNVGIGTTNPGYKLTIDSNNQVPIEFIDAVSATGKSGLDQYLQIRFNGTNRYIKLYSD